MHDKLFSQYWKLTPNFTKKTPKNQFICLQINGFS